MMSRHAATSPVLAKSCVNVAMYFLEATAFSEGSMAELMWAPAVKTKHKTMDLELQILEVVLVQAVVEQAAQRFFESREALCH
mmetsp:Transcript_104482/g.270871  ORF Transcript_104482/g.270871 Transcript_104482/m.270871 type:complete len:83 (-) Transcript_104482:415-663(-)